jgi:hypothetical protein
VARHRHRITVSNTARLTTTKSYPKRGEFSFNHGGVSALSGPKFLQL